MMDGQCNDGGRPSTMSKLVLARTTPALSSSIAPLSAKRSGDTARLLSRKKRIGVLNACVTIVSWKIPAIDRLYSTITAPEQMDFALQIERRPEIQLGSSGGSQERFEEF
jgi:hypothetical protein